MIRVAAIIILALLFMIGVGFGLLQTGGAKRLVARKLTELLGKELGPGSVIRGISGFIPFNIEVGEIKLCDQQGDWLRIENFSFRFSPSQLFRLKVRIDELSAGLMDLKRLPESKEVPAGEKKNNGGGGGLPRNLPELELTRLSIRRLILGKELSGERTILNLDGTVNYNPDSESAASLKITGTESPILSASIEGRAGHDFERLDLKIGVADEAGGILSGILGLSEAGPISFQIHGEGPTDCLHTDLKIDIKKVGSIRGLMDLNIQRLGADGEISVTIDKLDSLSHLTKDLFTGSFHASIRLNQKNGVQNGSIEAKIINLSTGSINAAETDLSINLNDVINSPSGDISLSITDLNYSTEAESGTAKAGTAGFHLIFSGPPDKPAVDLNLQVKGITFPSFPLNNPDPVAFSLEAHLKDKRISSKVELSGRSDIHLQGNAGGGAKLTLSPFSFDLPSDKEIEAKLNGRIELELLSALEELSRQSLTGNLAVDFSTVGTIQKPEYRGRIKIENGEYQNLDSGTVLTEIQVDVEIDRSGVVIKQFEANDPNAGKLAIDGQIALSPEKNYPFSSSLILTSMEVADTDIYWATVTGKITVSGNMDGMDVKGGIEVDRAGFRIPKTSSPSVVGIPVIEINKPGDSETVTPAAPSPFLKNIDLGLTIKSVDQISVSGRGLSSTWGTDISIGGTAAAPIIKGGLKLSDGYFLFLGKRLELANCSISLAGGVPISPQININAQITSGGILINLQIVGSPESPKLILTSQPPHPPDEILARLLFGASKASLTAMEGLRVAYGLQVLQGGNDVVDYLTGWTSFLGGPQLNISQYANDPNVTAVSAKWELSDDISVENQKSLAGSGDLVIFYLDITRWIQLMTIAGVSGAGDGARVRWHYDF